MGSLFSGPDGPLQVSSRKGSVRSGQGVTYFQPEELAGNVQLGEQIRWLCVCVRECVCQYTCDCASRNTWAGEVEV